MKKIWLFILSILFLSQNLWADTTSDQAHKNGSCRDNAAQCQPVELKGIGLTIMVDRALQWTASIEQRFDDDDVEYQGDLLSLSSPTGEELKVRIDPTDRSCSQFMRDEDAAGFQPVEVPGLLPSQWNPKLYEVQAVGIDACLDRDQGTLTVELSDLHAKDIKPEDITIIHDVLGAISEASSANSTK